MTWLVAFLYDKEEVVVRRLYQDGHDTFPQGRVIDDPDSRDNGRFRLIQRNLYPGYLFVRQTERWPSAAHIFGVKFLHYREGNAFRPHTLTDEEFDRAVNRKVETAAVHVPFERNDLVKVTAGNWSGFMGTFKKHNHGRGQVDIDAKHRSVPVWIPLHQLTLMARAPRASSTGFAATA